MFNVERYRNYDRIQLIGVCKDVFVENENCEIEPTMLIDFDVKSKLQIIKFDEKSPIVMGKTETTLQDYILDFIGACLGCDLIAGDVCICGNTLQIWINEDEDGCYCEDGKYMCLYSFILEINGTCVEETDLHELLPEFEY